MTAKEIGPDGEIIDTKRPVELFADKAKRVLKEALEKEFPGENNAALRAEITAEIYNAVAYETQSRSVEYVPPVRKLEEYNNFMEKEVAYAAEQTALAARKLGLFDGVIVHRVEKKESAPPETQKATPTGNIKVFRRTSTTSSQVGLISFIELEDYLMLTRTESKDPASLIDTYAKLFAEYDVDGISWPADTHRSVELKKYEKKWAEIGATISSTKNGYYYKLTRDSLSKYLMESRLSKEEKSRQKALVNNTLEFTGGILSRDQDEQIKASIIGARFDGDIDAAIDMIVGENDFVDINGLKSRANDIEASLSGGTYTGAAVDAVKSFVHQSSNLSNMPEPLFKQMRNNFMKFGGIKHSRLRRWLSLPFTNSLKSDDWKRMWTVFVERIMNKEKDTYNILARGDFFLNREKYLKQQGYSRAQIKETTKRLERISFIMDENLRNDIHNAGEGIKAIDEQIEREPLLVDMDKLEARKIELQQRINTLTEKRMYSLEELKAGIKDWD
jgi:hypothetical protein